MNAILRPPPDALSRQRDASDPRVSAWVSAHAGSGKTRVLTDRVIRLLLHGVEPSQILCLTYTKAAAANMANRVFDTLGRWAQLDDEALRAEVEALEDRPLLPSERAEARRLFARALECPGGLKVQTVHAFAERLLHQFPFEAEVPASFAVLDDAESAALLELAREQVLNAAARDERGPLGSAVRQLALGAADVTLDKLMKDVIGRRQDIGDLSRRQDAFEEVLAALRVALGVGRHDSLASLDWFPSPHFPEESWQACIAALEASGANDREQADRLRRCLLGEGPSRLAAYLEIFIKKTDGELRKEPFTKPFRGRHPALAEAARLEAERLLALRERAAALETLEATTALLRVAVEVIASYARLKRDRGVLDFDDLVQSVRRLVGDQRAQWVLYKLDGGIDHILIDEAQDTSPAQWEIVAQLAGEFFSGDSARTAHRTLFAVGDEKQSIYSFQGARPDHFDRMRRRFEAQAKQVGHAFERVPLFYSFRSTEHVLGAVDAVFKRPSARKGLVVDDVAPVHQAVRENAPGFVEIWPLVEPLVEAESPAWDAPFDARNHDSPTERLAREIAGAIGDWLARGAALGDGRPIGAQDILILVQRRGALFEAIIRELKTANVPVAGADRLKLLEHIAVMDCLAAAEFALLPDDDLTLATVLRSPLIGLSEETLFALAHPRRGSLWSALARAAADDPALETARARLAGWLERADFVRPFEFFSALLTADGGRGRMFARLGTEAADALDELLNLALAYERVRTPSLQGFVHWLRHAEPDVKRSLDMARDEVRVMTVHNAKGLEAPIVFLADTTRVPTKGLLSPLVFLGEGRDAPRTPVWRAPGGRDPAPVTAARDVSHEAQLGEHRRLLYVAMTRAADRLYVCGVGQEKKRSEGNWYDLIREALEPEARVLPASEGAAPRLRWAKTWHDEPACRPGQDAIPGAVLPDWIARPAIQERVARPLAVSSLLGTLEAGAAAPRTLQDRFALATDPQRRFALERGSMVHRLLQSLPELPPADRRAAGERYLAAQAPIDPGLRGRLLDEVLALFADPAFAPVFTDGSRAEVPVAGLLVLDGEEKPVSGVVDRLVVLPDRVLLVDYKTNREPPRSPQDTPKAYKVQLAAYRRLLLRIYPDRPIEAALLWTAAPRLMAFPDAILDDVLA